MLPRKLLALTGLLILCLAGGIAISQRSVVPVTVPLLAFNPSDCELPCVLGITPGKTSEIDAMTILDARTTYQNTIEPDYQYQLNGDTQVQPYIGVRYLDSDEPHTVYQIRVTTGYDQPLTTLGQLISAGHPINRVLLSRFMVGTPDDALMLFTFGPDEQLIAVATINDRVALTSEISAIYSLGQQDRDLTIEMIRHRWGANWELPWLGFASVARYRQFAPGLWGQ